jgi:hypothetical protein
MQYKITISFTDTLTGEEIVHNEAIDAKSEGELQQFVPKLLMTLSQTGYIRYNVQDGWRLLPGSQLRDLRARLSSRIILTGAASGLVMA